jgi:ABC-type lipoprotein release transport system permease subunit
VAGIEPLQEDKLTLLAEKLSSGTYLQHNDNGALLAEGLAKRLGLATGDTLVLLGQGYQDVFAAGKFEVKGTVHFGSPELNDGMVYLALPAAQQWLNANGRLTSLALDLGDPSMLQQAQSSVRAAAGKQYEVMTWEEMMPQLSNHIKADSMSMYIFSGVLYMIVGFGIFGTVLMMTAERRFELGMLIAIGMKRGLLAKMLLIETAYISLLGVALGSLISLPAVLWLQSHPIRFTGQMAEVYQRFGFEAVLPATLNASIFLWQAIIVLILALVAGLYPALYVRKINPASIRQ